MNPGAPAFFELNKIGVRKICAKFMLYTCRKQKQKQKNKNKNPGGHGQHGFSTFTFEV